MVFDVIREFVALSEQVGVKGSDHRIRELMTTLRRSGFSSPQISELSGGKWSGTLVRQYTRGWGGGDGSLSLQRESLVASLRKLVSSGRGVEDIDAVLRLDASVRAKGSSPEEVAELNSNLGKLDLQRGEIGKLVTLSRDLVEEELNPGMVRAWMALDQELIEDGFNKTNRIRIRDMCNNHGGVYGTLELLNEYNNLGVVLQERTFHETEVKQLKSEADRLRDDKKRLDAEISQSREMINATNAAALAGFYPLILNMISVLAKDLGGPLKVVTAIQKYPSLKEMDEELEALKAELEKVIKEIANKSVYLAALNYSLNEAERAYEENRDVRRVVELLVNPRGIKTDRSDVVRLIKRVLESGAQRIEESPTIPLQPSSAWDAAYENIKALALKLQALTGAEA
jgi:hypothetical protein